jgi:hypothetical protein
MVRNLHTSTRVPQSSERYVERYAKRQVGSERYYEQAAYAYRQIPSFTCSCRKDKEMKSIELERRGEEFVMVRRRVRVVERDGWRERKKEVE